MSAQRFSRARSPLSAVLLLGLTMGCGYSDYMRKYQESLAKIDFAEKRDKLLGPYVGTADQGIRVRLPVQVSTEPLSGREIGELPKDPATLIFPSKPGASRPIRVAIFVTRSTRESEAMSLENLAFYVFDSRQTEIWMGPGAEFGDEGSPCSRATCQRAPPYLGDRDKLLLSKRLASDSMLWASKAPAVGTVRRAPRNTFGWLSSLKSRMPAR